MTASPPPSQPPAPPTPTSESPRRAAPPALTYQIIAITIARTVLNTGHRMAYPFLPTLARGLGVDREAISLALAARNGLGLGGPLFGSLADRRGRRVAMVGAMLAFGAAMLLVLAWPTYPALFIGLLLAGAAKLVYDPAMQAYVGDRVPYARRGRAIAITELSWSLAFLLGMPMIGWLIARTDAWQAPFPLLGVVGLLTALLLARLIPSDRPPRGTPRPSLIAALRTVSAHPVALAGLTVGLLISLGNELVSVVYGAWLEDAFDLQVAALGTTAIVIGVAELAGEGGVGGLVDRIGKRRAVALGAGLNVLAALGLPALDVAVGGALVGLFLFYITFEFALVSSIPLMTELVPSARATLMAGNVAAMSAGRMVGAVVGPLLFDGGILVNALACAAINLIALAVLLLFVKQD